MGVEIHRTVKKGMLVALYGGKYIACQETGSMRRAYLSRYCVSIRAADMIKDDSFVCYAGPSNRRNLKWFKDNNNQLFSIFSYFSLAFSHFWVSI